MKIFYNCLFLALLGRIILTDNYGYLYYTAVMIGSVVFLNRQEAFKNLPNHRVSTALFMGYLAFIVANRTRSVKFSLFTEESLNIAEHGFFALVICLKLFVYVHLFTAFSLRKKAIFAVLGFNIVGIFNEIFQNWLSKRPIFLFIADARKDMVVNLLGSFLFLLFFTYFYRNEFRQV